MSTTPQFQTCRTVALIDPPGMFTGFGEAVCAAGHNLVRVETWSDVKFSYVHRRNANVSLCGVPLEQIEVVFYSGPPRGGIAAPRDEAFVETERDRALAAAFLTHNTRVINAGWSLSTDWISQTPESQLLKLSDAGWPIADIVWRFDVSSGISKETYGTNLPKVFLVVGRKRHYVIADGAGEGLSLSDQLNRTTRKHLAAQGLDWATIPVAIESESRFAACGFGTWLPEGMTCEMRGALLADAIAS